MLHEHVAYGANVLDDAPEAVRAMGGLPSPTGVWARASQCMATRGGGGRRARGSQRMHHSKEATRRKSNRAGLVGVVVRGTEAVATGQRRRGGDRVSEARKQGEERGRVVLGVGGRRRSMSLKRRQGR